MIQILQDLAIPENEISFTASRSGGPGGQNVNKVSTKMTLSFDVMGSAVLSDDQKNRIKSRLGKRINSEGILQIASQRTRSQELNREDAIERFSELLRRALRTQQTRVKTRIPAAVKQRRVEKKRKHGVTKQLRSTKGWDS